MLTVAAETRERIVQHQAQEPLEQAVVMVAEMVVAQAEVKLEVLVESLAQ